MRVVMIDHYDSFSHNLLDWLAGGSRSLDVCTVTYDDPAAMAMLITQRQPLVISPGPRAPSDAPTTLEVLSTVLGTVPILGVCLGFQMLATLAGAEVVRSAAPLHGERRQIMVTDASGFLQAFPQQSAQAAYHSLAATDAPLAAHWHITARALDCGEPQVLEYRPPRGWPALGLQFHPESFLSQHAEQLCAAFEDQVAAYYARI